MNPRRAVSFVPLIVAFLLASMTAPVAAQGVGVEGAWYSAEPQSYFVFSVGTTRPLAPPLRLSLRGSWYSPSEASGGSLLGVGVDLSTWRGGNPGLYAVAGVDGGFGFNGAEMLWGSYSIGLGWDFRLFSAVGLGVEARWRGLTEGGTEGVQVGIRMGGGMRRKAAAPSAGTPTSSGTPPSSPAPTVPTSPASPLAGAVVTTALGAMGTPYAWGGSSSDGFDCSGLIQYAYGAHGVPLPRTSAQQAVEGTPVEREVAALQPGDILTFTANPGGSEVNHVGLYVGGGEFIHSATGGVQKSQLSATDTYGKWWWNRWVGARRVVPAP